MQYTNLSWAPYPYTLLELKKTKRKYQNVWVCKYVDEDTKLNATCEYAICDYLEHTNRHSINVSHQPVMGQA